jgi:hypothetical protein
LTDIFLYLTDIFLNLTDIFLYLTDIFLYLTDIFLEDFTAIVQPGVTRESLNQVSHVLITSVYSSKFSCLSFFRKILTDQTMNNELTIHNHQHYEPNRLYRRRMWGVYSRKTKPALNAARMQLE